MPINDSGTHKAIDIPEITRAVKQQRDLCWLGEKDPAVAIREVRRLADAAIARNERRP